MAILVVQATTMCNSQCQYCYRKQLRKRASSMSVETLAVLFRRISEYLYDNPTAIVEIQWHGGEPLLAGEAFFEKVVELQSGLPEAEKRRVRHTLQSNLTLLNNRILSLLRILGIQEIGTSYDPTPGMRFTKNPLVYTKYATAFINALSMIEKLRIEWGVIYVVTRNSLEHPTAPFFFLTNLNIHGKVSFNPVLLLSSSPTAEYMITPEEFLSFLGTILPIWWTHRNRFPLVEPFHSAVTLLQNGNDRGCSTSLYPPLLITPEGNVHIVGRPDESETLSLGSLAENRLLWLFHVAEEVYRNATIQRMQKNGCDECEIYRQCQCGKVLGCFSQEDTYNGKSNWCETRKTFINSYIKPLIKGERVNV